MKIVYTGLESSGKTLMLAKKIQELVARNKRWRAKYGFTRLIYSNLIFSDTFGALNKDFLRYWVDCRSLYSLTGVDIIWDEISSDFSALKKEPLPRRVNRWLRQGAKQGVHIYATAQEYHDIHLDFRRRVFQAFYVTKILGSRRSGNNLPPIDFIWGACMSRELKIRPYNELVPAYLDIIPSFFLITQKNCDVFDTSQLITESPEPPFEHTERYCPVCRLKKTYHT